MVLTILYLLGSIILVGLGVIFYLFTEKIFNKEWRILGKITSIAFMVYGLSNFIYLTLSRLFT